MPTKTGSEVEKRENEETREEEKLKEYSPQAIIEATVPKVRLHKQDAGANRAQVLRREASDRVHLSTWKSRRMPPSLRKKVLVRAHTRNLKRQLL